MLTVVILSVLIFFGCSVDLAYRLGLSKRGDHQQETRTSIFIDVAGMGISLGFVLGLFVIRLANIEDDFARVVIAVMGAAVGFFAPVLIGGDKAIARFFGVELTDPS